MAWSVLHVYSGHLDIPDFTWTKFVSLLCLRIITFIFCIDRAFVLVFLFSFFLFIYLEDI